MLDSKTLKAVESWLRSKKKALEHPVKVGEHYSNEEVIGHKILELLIYELEGKRMDIETAQEATEHTL